MIDSRTNWQAMTDRHPILAELAAIERERRIFRGRVIVRDITRMAYVECEGDPVQSQKLAETNARNDLKARLEIKYGSIVGAIILAIIVNLVAGWIADFIREWLARGVKSPAMTYQPWEPGYEAMPEDEE